MPANARSEVFYQTAAAPNDRMFIKSFLIDGSENVNHWGLDPAHIKDHLGDFIGRPIVLTAKYDHPSLPVTPGEDIFSYMKRLLDNQEQYRIGTITEIQEKEGAYYAISEITNALAKQAIRTQNVPLYVSPAVYMLDPREPDNAIKTYMPMHVAIVDDPAYTVKKARIDNTCTGEAGACLAQLRTAKVEPQAFTCACPGKLLEALAIKFSSSKHAEQSNITMTDDVSALKAELESLKAANKTLQSENDKLKTVNGELSEQFKQVSASVEQIKKEARKDKIASIITPDIFEKPEEREAKIAKLTETNMSIEDISDMYSTVKEAKLKLAKAGQGSEKPNFKASNGAQKTAKAESNGVPEWVQLAGYSIK